MRINQQQLAANDRLNVEFPESARLVYHERLRGYYGYWWPLVTYHTQPSPNLCPCPATRAVPDPQRWHCTVPWYYHKKSSQTLQHAWCNSAQSESAVIHRYLV